MQVNDLWVPVLQLNDYVIDPHYQDMTIDGRLLTLDGNDTLSTGGDPYKPLSEFPIASIKGVEIIYSRKYTNRGVPDESGKNIIYGMQRPVPFAKIVITTIHGRGWYRENRTGTTIYRPIPIMHPQQFYSPKYNIAPKLIEPDYRSTFILGAQYLHRSKRESQGILLFL